MKTILIFGCGSIGNHMSFASRKLGYKVYITDINEKAMIRMKNEIFPKRYKKWDNKINLISYNNVFDLNIEFDLIIIGTPPSSHLKIFKICKSKLKFKNILIEKPLTTVENKLLNKNLFLKKKYNIYCGYNHSISKSVNFLLRYIRKLSKVKYVQVHWKEGWRGIMGAHFWMKNEFSSYLGNIKEGGGSLHEHSHGLHLLFLILKRFQINLEIENFKSKILYLKKKSKKYDQFSSFVGNKKNIIFKYETDLISEPAEKSILILSENLSIQLIFNFKKNFDAIIINKNNSQKIRLFKKTRSSEFENELKHIINSKNKANLKSNLSVDNAISVMKIIKKVIKNAKR